MSRGGTGDSFDGMWESLAPIGREPGGGYRRLAWSDADLACRAWFRHQAAIRGLTLDEDPNGNQWAWWGGPADGALVTGSHLDSVPGGGAFDGPLGVVSGFAALDRLRAVRRDPPARPVAVVNFGDEEGGRWGVACVGSRLMSGQIDPRSLLDRADDTGVTLADARRRAGVDAEPGADPLRLGRIGTFVELHIEQGRHLVDVDVPVGVATAVWPHGRWRMDFSGRGDHAGTTRLVDRSDPVLVMAQAIVEARAAAEAEGAVATVGRVAVSPGATNAIASHATAWLDARAAAASAARAVVSRVAGESARRGARAGVGVGVVEESWSDGTDFGAGLRDRVAAVVAGRLGSVTTLGTGAGHDAAIIAASAPTAMLFVRNPTGISHDPAEYATPADCAAGVDALTAVLEDLL